MMNNDMIKINYSFFIHFYSFLMKSEQKENIVLENEYSKKCIPLKSHVECKYCKKGFTTKKKSIENNTMKYINKIEKKIMI